MQEEFKTILGRFLQRSYYSASQISSLTSIPRRAILNWTGGRVRKPQDWRNITRVAAALQLTEDEANELLSAAGHSSIAELRQKTADSSSHTFLDPWPESDDVPFQAISDLPYFVGRKETIDKMAARLKNGSHVTICSLHGMGGVGKTSLAARLAYRLRRVFPDGVLWARLDTSDTMSILSTFASAYGVDVGKHQDLDSRAAVVRNLLADKKVLIILDNAENSSQVRPLLPPTTGKTAVILTTRHDLAVSDEMQRFTIEPFKPDSNESLDVFSHFLGKRTVSRWYNELKTIADMLGHLPLAIAIAAALMKIQGNIRNYLGQLQAAEKQLDSLIREDRSVRISFDLSFQALSPVQQHVFTILGTFGAEDFSVEAASYVADRDAPETQQLINHLVQASLVRVGRNGRFALHPLLHTYAQENLKDEQAEPRMVHYFVNFAAKNEYEYDQINLERDNLISALATAKKRQMLDDYLEGVYASFRAWYHLGEIAMALPYLTTALEIAETAGNKQRLADIYSFIGTAYVVLAEPDKAKYYHENALKIAYETENTQSTTRSLINLGAVEADFFSNFDKAMTYYSAALKATQELNNPYMEAILMSTLANYAYQLGDWDQAINYNTKELALLTDNGYENDTEYVRACTTLATIQRMRGQFTDAEATITNALNCAKKQNYSELIAISLSIYGSILVEQNKYAQADAVLDEALNLARNMNLGDLIMQTLSHLGLNAMQTGDFTAAKSYYDEELSLSRSAQIVWMEGDALCSLGDWHLETGEVTQAREHFEQALSIAKKLNLNETKAYALWGLARSGGDNAIQCAQESLILFEKFGHKLVPVVGYWLKSNQLVTSI